MEDQNQEITGSLSRASSLCGEQQSSLRVRFDEKHQDGVVLLLITIMREPVSALQDKCDTSW